MKKTIAYFIGLMILLVGTIIGISVALVCLTPWAPYIIVGSIWTIGALMTIIFITAIAVGFYCFFIKPLWQLAKRLSRSKKSRSEPWFQRFMESTRNQQMLAQEEAVLKITETICGIMDKMPDKAEFLKSLQDDLKEIIKGSKK